jgi:hypothetical protein
MKILTDNRFARVEDVIWRRIGDDVVVITADGQSTHILNKTAAIIWEASGGGTEITRIAELLCERFEVSLERARADVKEFLGVLIRLNIMKPVEEPTVE